MMVAATALSSVVSIKRNGLEMEQEGAEGTEILWKRPLGKDLRCLLFNRPASLSRCKLT